MRKFDCYICQVNYEAGEGSTMLCPECYPKWMEDVNSGKAENATMYVANNRTPGLGVQAIIVNDISLEEFSILMTEILGVYGARDLEIWDNHPHKVHNISSVIIGFKSSYANAQYYFKDKVEEHKRDFPDSVFFSKAKEMTRERTLEEIKGMASLEANEADACFGRDEANEIFNRFMSLYSHIKERS